MSITGIFLFFIELEELIMSGNYYQGKKIVQTLGGMALDTIMIIMSYLFIVIMFNVINIELDIKKIGMTLPCIVIFKLVIFYFSGFYKMLPKHVGFEDVMRISIVVALTNILIVLYIALSKNLFMFKTAFIYITALEAILLTMPRVANRMILYFKMNMINQNQGRRTLIVGAGSAGELTLREIYRNRDLTNHVVAYIDDNQIKIGSKLNNIPIVGPSSRIKEYIDELLIEEVIIAINHGNEERIISLMREISEKNVKISRLITYSDVSKKSPKIVDVKVEDLLNREPIVLDNALIHDFIKGEVVLVTGGGGSIGSELCRQIADFKPKQLIIFDIYENNAYDIQQELLRKFKKNGDPSELNLLVLIGSVYNEKRLEHVFETYRPTVVFHAAAYKHVPLMEDSPMEAVRTNVIGTNNAARLSNKYGVKKFVLVSSDKAVRSTNVMGATKRFAELIIQSHNNLNLTKFASVRFGNVLGSNGSVIPLFKKQIEDGGPVTVTHPEITRYFMTIPEAVSLILQCAVYADGGEVFVLDMGEAVKITDLAKKMIRLAGLKPDIDIKIEFTGLRPGEKLYEELLIDHSTNKRTENKKIFVEEQRDVTHEELQLELIQEKLEDMNVDEVKQMVQSIVKTYKMNGKDAN